VRPRARLDGLRRVIRPRRADGSRATRRAGQPTTAAGDARPVVLRSVEKVFARGARHVVALAPLTLTVRQGEAVALVGPNGAGKTTTLRIIATLVEPSAGIASVLGRDVIGEARFVRRVIGVSLGSTRSFYWRLTARHNLTFFGRLRGMTGTALRDAVREAASALGIASLLDAPVRRLSRGTVARLAVARAVLGDPAVILLDEPFAAVDSLGRDLIWRLLEERTGRGASVVLATHDMWEAERCGRVIELRPGSGRSFERLSRSPASPGRS
jgi:ABC-2 type transport system ATP-binding protein